MEFGHPVVYNGGQGKERTLAFVVAVHADKADLVVLTEDGLSHENDVPRRAPRDYKRGGGGGRTWHDPAVEGSKS